MKKAIAPLIVILLALMLAGCGQSPKSTARSFTENLAHGKIDEAKKYATDQTGQFLDMASSMGALPIDPNFEFIFIEERVEGNSAVVTYKESKDVESKTVDLVKIDGRWKVHMKK